MQAVQAIAPDQVLPLEEKPYRLLPHQSRVLRSTARLALLTGGLGSAKTTALAWWGIERFIACVGVCMWPVLLYSPTFPLARRILVPTLQEIAAFVGSAWEFSPSSHIFELEVDGVHVQLPLLSASEDNHVKGTNVACAGVDEAGQVSKSALKHIRARCRHPRASPFIRDATTGLRTRNLDWIPGSILQALFVGTPEGCNGYFWEAATGQTPRMLHGLTTGRVERIKARTLDNPNLPDDYIEELGDFDDAEREMFLNGEFVPGRGRCYSHFTAKTHVEKFTASLQGWNLAMGCDFNVDRQHWTFWAWKGHGPSFQAHCIGEQRGGSTTEEAAERAADWWARRLSSSFYAIGRLEASRRVEACCDAAGAARSTKAKGTDLSALRSVGFKVSAPHQNPHVKDRVFTVQSALRRGLVKFDPSATFTIRALENQGKDDNGDPIKDNDDHLDDATDSVGYFAWRHIPKLRPAGGVREHSRSYR